MNGDEFDLLAAQGHALSMVVSAVIGGLTPVAAAEAAVNLLIAQAEERQADANGDTSPLASRTRDGVLDAYLSLLSARSKAG